MRESTLRIEGAVFTFAIGLLLVGAVATALSWPLRASIIVLVLGGTGIALALAQLALDLSRSGPGPQLTMEAPAGESGGRWGHLEIWAWILGLYLGIHLLGFPLALPLFVFAYVKVYGGGWGTALALTALAGVFIYGVFERLLHVPWPKAWLSYIIMM